MNSIRNITSDDLLAAIGLQTRRTAADMVLPALGVFGTGLLLGAGLGLLFAPKTGAQSRQFLGDNIDDLTKKIAAKFKRANGDDAIDVGGMDVTDADARTPRSADAPRNGGSSSAGTPMTSSLPGGNKPNQGANSGRGPVS